MATGRKKKTRNKNDMKIAYTPKTQEEKDKIMQQLIKDLKSRKKVVPTQVGGDYHDWRFNKLP